MQRAEARLDRRHRRLSECRRHLNRLHRAGLPGQDDAVHGRAAGRVVVDQPDPAVWRIDPHLRKRLRRPAPADRRAARSRTRNKLPARPDPRRRRHGAERNRRGVRGRDRDRRGGDAAARGGQTPLREEVKGFCEILGLDLLYLANEGKLVAIVPEKAAEAALAALRRDPLGREAAVIGRVVQGEPGRVTMRTAFGGSRIVDMLVGEQLPRIC
jgi:hypothetical protein